MSSTQQLGVLAVNNPFVEDTTNVLSEYFYIRGIILKGKKDECKINRNHKVKLIFINKKSVIDLLKLPRHIMRVEKEVDGFIVHYLNPYFAILLALGIIKKPMIYFCYGGDVYKTGLRKWLVKKALKKIDLICVELKTQQIYIQERYNISKEKITSSVIIWNVNQCFKRFSGETIKILKEKWKLTKEYVIFSPRTVTEVYNHHLLIKGLNLLDEQLKNKIQVVIVGGHGSETYRNELIELANACNVEIVDLRKQLAPEEMAEIFNISLINVNIPKYDQFGMSIMEGSICGSMPLLNMEISTYHEWCEDGINCIFVKPQPKDIAEKIEYLINNSKKLKEEFYLTNSKIFEKRLKYEENIEELAKMLRKLVHNSNK